MTKDTAAFYVLTVGAAPSHIGSHFKPRRSPEAEPLAPTWASAARIRHEAWRPRDADASVCLRGDWSVLGVKMARLRIALLGGYESRLDGAPLDLRLPRKALGLLAYLAVGRGRPSSRDRLGALLWSGGRPEQARHSVRQALLSTRQALSACGHYEALLAAGDTLALDPRRVDVDVAEFEALLDDGALPALEGAAALYGGAFLEGFRVGEPGFDDWIVAERARLRERAGQALSSLLAHHEGAGAVEPAIATAVRLLRVDHTQEPVHRTLIQLYHRVGRRADALRQYRTCVAMLRTELGIEPAPETTRLYREILGPASSPRRPVPEP